MKDLTRAMDWPTVRLLEEEGYITVQKHSTAELWILNYSQKCQFAGYWTEETMQCRGLIVDADFRIVARPFVKFFNLEQHLAMEGMPALKWDEPYFIQEKMDGSLGILYWVDGVPCIATRGSFTSDQAVFATNLLRTKYAQVEFYPEHTYLFEIIYPANRIVVDYGDREELVLLSVIDTATGQPIVGAFDHPFREPKIYPADTSRDKLHELVPNDGSTEGLVIRFADGQRVKVKTDEYVRLHRLLTQVSSKSIWELLRAGSPLDEIVDKVPDEFYDWVRSTRESLESQHAAIMQEGQALADAVRGLERPEAARIILTHNKPITSVAFSLLDGKVAQATDTIWKFIKPTYEKPFKTDIDL